MGWATGCGCPDMTTGFGHVEVDSLARSGIEAELTSASIVLQRD